MNIRWLGAVLVIVGCGGVGFMMAAHFRRELHGLKQLNHAIDYMICDLQYRQTPLPELVANAAQQCANPVKDVMLCLSAELASQIAPDANCCMKAALARFTDLPKHTAQHLQSLGMCLGIFDLEGQIAGLQAVRSECEEVRKGLEENRPQRLRSYQTLGLCAGAALAILFV